MKPQKLSPPPPRYVSVKSRVLFVLITKLPFFWKIAAVLKNFIALPGIWGKATIKRLLKKGYKPAYTTDKIAFVIGIDWAFDHLEKIFSNFNYDEYDLVYTDFGEIRCKEYAVHSECNVISIQSVIKNKLGYSLAVISLPNTHKDGIDLIAAKIMLVASLIDNDYCNMMDAKQHDYVVCGNEYQKAQFEKIVSKEKLFVLGFPRLNNCKYDKDSTRRVIRDHTGCDIDTNKKTLLWLPSHTEVASFINFVPMISKLQHEFNIIEKPHPLIYYEKDNFEKFMQKNIPEIIIVNDVDSVNLIPVADFIACDYGGSVFYAIHADKNVILLNTPKPELLTGTFATSVPSNIIRDRIINFYPDEEEKFFAALKDDSVWEKQKEIRAQIRAEFFTDNPDPARDIAELCRRIVRGEI
jgi:hypothetical protein